jgi:transglutaminase-like putative cysteine protease
MTIYAIRHSTAYTYRRPVRLGRHDLLFRPRDSYDQRLIEARLDVEPRPSLLRWSHDVFGNCIAHVAIEAAAAEFSFRTRIVVDHFAEFGADPETDAEALSWPFAYGPEESADLASTIRPHYGHAEIDRFARRFVKPGGRTDTGRMLMTLCYAIHEGFAYARRSAPGTQAPALTLEIRRGTCRDFALLMMEAVRSLGLAARFVTGYLYVPDRDSAETRGGGSTHAWCQVYLPGAGWVEFDPTTGIVGSRDLIRVGVARDPSQAVPLSGSYVGAPGDCTGMEVEVIVTAEPETAYAAGGG